jgi:hypothetical protein
LGCDGHITAPLSPLDVPQHRLKALPMLVLLAQVRAARNLPIKLLAAEYERILRRRLPRVGGSPEDGALKEMLACFKCAPRRRGAGAAMPACGTAS